MSVDEHPDHEPLDDTLVFTFLIRRGIRETTEEAHRRVIQRWKKAKVEGDIVTYSTLAAEVQRLARDRANVQAQLEGPPRHAALRVLRDTCLDIAVSALALAERATRPPEPPRGERGGRKGEGQFRRPDFSVPATL